MHDLSNLTGPNALIVGVKQVIVHDRYAGISTSSGDIALVELQTRVNFTRFIYPVCLPPASAQLKSGLNCSVTGWGNIQNIATLPPPQTLQEGQAPLIDTKDCNAMFQNFLRQSSLFKPVRDDMVCAGYTIGQKGFCNGDSGGPLACSVNGTWLLIGVMSWEATKCAAPFAPGVYTLITSYISWIKGYTPGLNCNVGSASVTTPPKPVTTTAVVILLVLPKIGDSTPVAELMSNHARNKIAVVVGGIATELLKWTSLRRISESK
ncbi:hypothetical protein NDU88_004292 [Pleurodeles waltl]|uniref:Peptidase S1 domain-containing protein n=1 Tax=Pleurodeles waltl TaxID=8319 RepID=A0AAV7PC24_PLEWA|nr:hypothetical protein NDU88_004292 [Pleurodeles waltl]